MAVRPSAEVTFTEDDLEPIQSVVEERLAAMSGWVNFQPQVEDGYEPLPRGTVTNIFSGRGEPVPLATWTAPEAEGRPATIGIQHGSGPKAVPRLAEQGLPLGAGWFKRADHSRRGLVVEVPADTDVGEVLRWLLDACHVLSVPPLTGVWIADVFDGAD